MAEETATKIPNAGFVPGWGLLSRCFRLALSPGQIGLAALGVISTAASWWLLASLFGTVYGQTAPSLGGDAIRGSVASSKDIESRKADWDSRKKAISSWNLMHEMAGLGSQDSYYDLGDVADSFEEYQALVGLGLSASAIDSAGVKPRDIAPSMVEQGKELAARFEKAVRDNKLTGFSETRIEQIRAKLGKTKPNGVLSTLPWFEDRGSNPLLFLMGKETRNITVQDWLLKEQGPVLVEPLVKLLKPVTYLFRPEAGFAHRLYLIAVILATIGIWSFFGGAITRMAAMELARHESVQVGDALKFSRSRLKDLVLAPLVPLMLIAGIMVLSVIFGFLYMIPVLGDIVMGGFGWVFPLMGGLAMAFLLVGLLSWPIMVAIVGTDSEDYVQATARGISYLYQRPRSIFLYAVAALLLGAASIFVVGFFSSLTVYLAKWSVAQTPGLEYSSGSTKPASLFVTAPTTFGWRALLLEGATVEGGAPLVVNGKVDKERLELFQKDLKLAYPATIINSAWLYAAVLLVVGFGYSFFWSASTALYLWLRHDIDGLEVSEVYLEDDDFMAAPAAAAPVAPAQPAPAPAAPRAGVMPLSVVDAPAAPQACSAPVEPTAPTEPPVS